MLVRDIMSPNLVSVTPEETVSLAARLLHRHNIGALPVCSADGRLQGMVTDRDIVLRCVAAECDPQATAVREVMTRPVVSIAPSDDVRFASRMMASEQIRRLPVVEQGTVVGMVSLGDMATMDQFDMEASQALSEISLNIKRA